MLLEQPNPGLLGKSLVARVEMGVPVTGDTNPRAQGRPLTFDIRLLECFFNDNVLHDLSRHVVFFRVFYLSVYLSIYLTIDLQSEKKEIKK